MTATSDRQPPITEAQRARFSDVVVPEIPTLLKVARSLCRSSADAEDLVQDTMIRALRGIDSFDGRYARAWLLTILRNTHLNRIRRTRPEPMDLGGEQNIGRLAWAATPPSVEDSATHLTFDTGVAGALAALRPDYRAVVERVDIDGLTYHEAAEALGIPAGTVMSRLHRARQRIRQHLEARSIAVPYSLAASDASGGLR